MATAAEIYAFRSRFPEFEDSKDGEIAAAIEMAALWVDASVFEPTDFPVAIQLWAAHYMTLLQAQLASAQLAGGGMTDTFVRSIGFGERRVMFGERGAGRGGSASSAPGESMLENTIYGQLFLLLRQRNSIGVEIV